MCDGPYGTSVVFLIHIMVDETPNGLKDEGSDNDDADDGMTVASRELNADCVSFQVELSI